jgi:hypothetical protein
MKHFARLMLLPLGMGVVAVVFAYLPLHTSAAPPPPAPSNSLVTLYQDSTFSSPCFRQLSPSGVLAPECYEVPAGSYLVVTEMQSDCQAGDGGICFFSLNYAPPSTSFPYLSSVVGDNPIGTVSHDHFSTGIVFSATPSYGADVTCTSPTCFTSMTLEGFGSSGTPTVPPLQ